MSKESADLQAGPSVASSKAEPISKDQVIGVVGAGTMGAGIAQVAATAGHPVLLFDAIDGAAAAGIERTRSGLDGLVSRGKMSADDRDALVARIQPCETLEQLTPAALVVEAIIEDLQIKQQLFRQLQDLCGPDVVLATNTSSISVTAIAAALERPQRLVGMHFFNPAPIMKLVEVISGVASDEAIVAAAQATATAWGKIAVRAKSTPGFIVNRVARPFYAEALRVLQECATDEASVDAIMRDCGGFRMGPFELMDLIGNDVNYAVTCSVYDAYFQDPRYRPSLIQQELVNAGHLGRKSGRGYFDYGDDAQPPSARSCEAVSPPASIEICGDHPAIDALADLAAVAGLAVARSAERATAIRIGSTWLVPANGQTATRRAAKSGHPNIVQFDLCADYGQAPRMAIAVADQATATALGDAVGLLQACGKQVTVIDDLPGMVCLRTVCMLANEGAEAVNQGVCDLQSVDQAMRFGVNYPQGPMAWADAIGVATVVNVLDHMSNCYGDGRYRVSPLLRRRRQAGQTLLSEE